MPLVKRISKIFRNDDPGNGTARVDRQEPSLAGPSICEEDDEQDIIAVTQASLQDEITRLEGCIEDQNNQISGLEQASSQVAQDVDDLRSLLISGDRENASLQTRADQAERRLHELDDTHFTELSSLNIRLRDLSAQVSAALQDQSQLREKKFRLEIENATLQNNMRALYALNQQYEAWVPRAKATQTEQEAKIRDLEQRLTLALQPMDEESRRAFNDGLQWSREKEELEARLEAEKTSTNLYILSLSNVSRDKEEQYSKERSTCESQIAALEAALEDEESENRDAKDFIQALEVHQESLQDEVDDAQSKLEEAQSQLSKLRALFGPDPTPRQFLFVKLFVRRFPRLQQNRAACSRYTQGHQAEDLTANDLDTPLAETSLATFVDSISPDSPGHHVLQRLQFQRCPGCKRHKVYGSPNERNHDLIEFPHWFRQNKCRTCTLCTDCLKEKLKKAITEDWWYELDSPHWLNCPVDGCQAPLEIGCVEALVETLRDFTAVDVAMLQGIYHRALALREALSRVDPRPGLDAISTSISLHQQLIAFGVFNNEFNVGTANYDNAAEPFDAGEVLMGSIDRGNLQIPIFTKFFRRSETAEDCPICLESFHEIEIESQERWTQACEGYHGAWMSEVFSFPTRDALRCDHDMNVCKQCLRRHLESQLEQHGRNARDRLTCITCNRVLSEQEIRCLGSTETVQKYVDLQDIIILEGSTDRATGMTIISSSRTCRKSRTSAPASAAPATAGKSTSWTNIPIRT